RQQAARDLLAYLKEFEVRHQPYHIVAHSHGGCVVLAALRQSGFLASASALRHLRSWTTVGTPFLSHKMSTTGISIIFMLLVAAGLVLSNFVTTALFWIPFGLCVVFVAWWAIAWFTPSQQAEAGHEKVWLRHQTFYNWLGVYSDQDEAIRLLKY